jgi:hypothetical protein
VATLQSSVRLKVLAVQILTQCLKGEFNYEKVLKLAADNYDGIQDIKGAVAALHFMLTNAAKFDVDEKSLVLEIQQLGLPKENTDAIAKQYRDTKDMLRSRFAEESYRVSRLVSADWRVDQIIATSQSSEATPADGRIVGNGPLVHIKLKVDTQPEKSDLNSSSSTEQTERYKNIAFEVSTQKLDVLIHELSGVQAQLQSMDS